MSDTGIKKTENLLHNSIMYDSLWYDSLIKPIFQPQAWVFSSVWVFLYTLLLVSVILYSLTITDKNKTGGYVCLIVHMVFNLLWSPVFFLLHRIDIALLIAFIMLFSVILMIICFFRVSKLSGLILFPYILWLIFAAYLNYQILILN